MFEKGKKLNIGIFDCWKCKRPIKVSWITGESFYGPEEFSENEIKLAKDNGIKIDKVYSKTNNEQYNANICPNCKAFVGKHFVHDYLYCEEVSIDI